MIDIKKRNEDLFQKDTIENNLDSIQRIIDQYDNNLQNLQILKNNITEKIKAIEKENSEQQKETKYENIQSLYTFDSYFTFKNFCFDLYRIDKWQIYDTDEKERIDILESRPYFQKLKTDFNSKNLSPYNITNKEVLSYLDTLSVLYKILENIQNQDFKKNVKIIMEYVPKLDSGKDRCDYVLAYRNILMLFEFGKCNDRLKIKDRMIEKEKELSYYESQIKKIIGNEIIIKKHAIIYQPEKDDKTIEENFNTINNASTLIKKWIKESNKNAIDYLNEEE